MNSHSQQQLDDSPLLNDVLKEVRRKFLIAFYLGVATFATLMCLFQNYIGKDKYIELVDSGWINIPWEIWIAVLFFIGIRVILFFRREAFIINQLLNEGK